MADAQQQAGLAPAEPPPDAIVEIALQALRGAICNCVNCQARRAQLADLGQADTDDGQPPPQAH